MYVRTGKKTAYVKFALPFSAGVLEFPCISGGRECMDRATVSEKRLHNLRKEQR